MWDNLQRRPRVGLLVCLFAVAVASSRCVTHDRGCAAAPPGIEIRASALHQRDPAERAQFGAFLLNHPGAASRHYGWDCATPLHSAAMRGRDDLAPLLIARGADVNARDKIGNTPLNVAATYGHANVLSVLLAAGANANGSGTAGTPPLQSAVGGEPGAPDFERQLAAIKVLLAAGADINGQEPGSARTALITAIGSGPRTGHGEPMIEFLLEHGADVHARDSQGTAALAYAAGTGNLRIVTLLLQRGADTRGAAKDEAALGQALSSAAGGGYFEIATLLIDRGANVNWRYAGPLRADWQAMPLATAIVARSGDKLTIARRRDVALALLAHGADVNARNERWQTLLHAAAADGDMPVIELLLSHGADIAPMDHAGFTPLHRAVQQGHLDAAARLIEAGADATTPAADGTTTLALASKDREMEALIRRHAKQ